MMHHLVPVRFDIHRAACTCRKFLSSWTSQKISFDIEIHHASRGITGPLCSKGRLFPARPNVFAGQSREYKRWLRPYLMELRSRQENFGPPKERARSEWINWNYEAELYAVGQRLGEEFDQELLRTAFIQRSYVEEEQRRRDEMGIEASLQITDNSSLSQNGRDFCQSSIKDYLHASYPKFPLDGVRSVSEYLLSEHVLHHVASKIGIKDLILSANLPVTTEELCDTLLAIVGALLSSQGSDRATLLVRDLLVSQLIGKDLNELWSIHDPMSLLLQSLTQQKKALPESRLIRSSAQNTILACYEVGLYSDKQLLASGYGESVEIAEEMAARNALKELFETSESRRPLTFG